MGELVHRYQGTLERFTGDGIMVFFNDPIPHDDAAERAVRMALEIRDAVSELAARWRRKGYDLALGQGIAQGFATLGRIGFEGRFDYAAIGSVTNLAARLCSDAGPWQVLVTDRVLAAIEHMAVAEAVGDVQPKGFSRTVRVHNISEMNGGKHMTQLQAAARTLGQLNDEERYQRFRRAATVDGPTRGTRYRRTWRTNRWSSSRRSASSAPPRPAAPSRKRWRSAPCSCCCCSVSRGCG